MKKKKKKLRNQVLAFI